MKRVPQVGFIAQKDITVATLSGLCLKAMGLKELLDEAGLEDASYLVNVAFLGLLSDLAKISHSIETPKVHFTNSSMVTNDNSC